MRFPSCLKPPCFQKKAWYITFQMKISHVNGIHADRLIGSEEFPKSSNKSDNAKLCKADI